jgi:cobalt/nickel transport system permease protein
MIAHNSAGEALYAPFGLHIAVPAMALEHLLLFGFVEAIATGLVVAFFQQSAPEMLVPATSQREKKPMALVTRVAIALGIMVVLAPLGLYLPEKFNAGAAWGEWSGEEIQTEIAKETGGKGYIPNGLQQAEAQGWKAPLPDYNLPGRESAPLSQLSVNYILSGAIGVMMLGLLIMLGKKLFARKDTEDDPPRVDAQPHHA